MILNYGNKINTLYKYMYTVYAQDVFKIFEANSDFLKSILTLGIVRLIIKKKVKK